MEALRRFFFYKSRWGSIVAIVLGIVAFLSALNFLQLMVLHHAARDLTPQRFWAMAFYWVAAGFLLSGGIISLVRINRKDDRKRAAAGQYWGKPVNPQVTGYAIPAPTEPKAKPEN
jgi:hypothetical protein